MKKDTASEKGIKTIAIFEMIKGFFAFIVGISVIILLHENLKEVAEKVIHFLHVDPNGHFAISFVEKAANINESNIILVIIIAFVYSAMRFIEGYGLWHLKAWAEWFAIISGGIYLPFEIYEMIHRPSYFTLLIIIINLLIVLYLIYVRYQANYLKNQH